MNTRLHVHVLRLLVVAVFFLASVPVECRVLAWHSETGRSEARDMPVESFVNLERDESASGFQLVMRFETGFGWSVTFEAGIGVDARFGIAIGLNRGQPDKIAADHPIVGIRIKPENRR